MPCPCGGTLRLQHHTGKRVKTQREEWGRITRQVASDPNSITLFAFEIKVLCGMSACVIEGNRAEMFAVWVGPADRRYGVGSALIEFARDWSKLHGATQLSVGVYSDNPSSLAFYRSDSFTDCGIIKPELSTEKRTVLTQPMN